MLHHPRLNLSHWTDAFPLANLNKSTDTASVMTGPLPIAYVEQIRAALIAKGANLGRAVPTDLCVWNLGDSDIRDTTKIGGVPYWPASEPWPMISPGKPYTFVAQLCFADSRDILPDFPGDILCVLAAENDYMDLELRLFELGQELLRPEDIPGPQWSIDACHATLHRTANYPDANRRLFDPYPFPLNCFCWKLDATTMGGAKRLPTATTRRTSAATISS
jgi:hypothetical protein